MEPYNFLKSVALTRRSRTTAAAAATTTATTTTTKITTTRRLAISIWDQFLIQKLKKNDKYNCTRSTVREDSVNRSQWLRT